MSPCGAAGRKGLTGGRARGPAVLRRPCQGAEPSARHLCPRRLTQTLWATTVVCAWMM